MKHLGKIALALALMGMIWMSPPGQASDVFETYFINVNGVMHEINYDPSFKLLEDRANGKLVFADVYEDEESNEAIHHKIDAYIAGLRKPKTNHVLPRQEEDEVIPGIPTNVYGNVFNIIDGKSVNGWAKRHNIVVPLSNGHYEFEEIDGQFDESPLLIKLNEGFMNVNAIYTNPANSPGEFHVSPNDPSSPFWHNGELTTDMWETAIGKWQYNGNDYKNDPWIHIFMNRTAGKATEVAALETAMMEWNTKWKGAAQAINAYIDAHGLDKPHLPEVLFAERSYKHSFTKATTDHTDHYGVNVDYGSGLNQTDLSRDGYNPFFSTVHLTNPDLGVAKHELGHVLGTYHVEKHPSLMNSSPGNFSDEDLKSFIIAYFDQPKFVKYLTNKDVEVQNPSPVENWQMY